VRNDLQQPSDRDDGKPWVPWIHSEIYGHVLPGHKERVSLEAWYDRQKQSLVLTLTQYDESMSSYLPCWAQLALIDLGPFFAAAEIDAFTELFKATLLEGWEVGSAPE